MAGFRVLLESAGWRGVSFMTHRRKHLFPGLTGGDQGMGSGRLLCTSNHDPPLANGRSTPQFPGTRHFGTKLGTGERGWAQPGYFTKRAENQVGVLVSAGLWEECCVVNRFKIPGSYEGRFGVFRPRGNGGRPWSPPVFRIAPGCRGDGRRLIRWTNERREATIEKTAYRQQKASGEHGLLAKAPKTSTGHFRRPPVPRLGKGGVF